MHPGQTERLEIRRHHGKTVFKVGAATRCRVADVGQIEIWFFTKNFQIFPCEFGKCHFRSSRQGKQLERWLRF